MRQLITVVPLLVIFLLAGKCDTGNCKELALVSDKSDLDGCGILLQTTNGSLLLPANLGEYDIELKDGATVSVSYKVVPDAMSICMKENATVMLSCIELYSK